MHVLGLHTARPTQKGSFHEGTSPLESIRVLRKPTKVQAHRKASSIISECVSCLVLSPLQQAQVPMPGNDAPVGLPARPLSPSRWAPHPRHPLQSQGSRGWLMNGAVGSLCAGPHTHRTSVLYSAGAMGAANGQEQGCGPSVSFLTQRSHTRVWLPHTRQSESHTQYEPQRVHTVLWIVRVK